MKKYEYPIISLILILGILSIGFSIYFFSKSWLFKSRATKTTGRIISINSRLGGKNKIKEYAPVILFSDAEGKELKYESNNYTLSAPKIGEEIEVYYSLNPLHAVENKFMSLWGISIGLFALGAALITFCLLYYRKGTL